MKRLFLFLFLLPSALLAQYSDSTRISLITCGPSQEQLYTAFGHSAFRVYDPLTGYDAAFNYGVFNFRQKHFYLNFARGYLYYQLGVHHYPDFEYHYIADNRYVHEQVLNLSASQRRRLIDYLMWNARPENQFYRYDYFYDNCATKMRDVLETALGDSISFDGSYIKTDYTIRELTDLYLPYQPWGDLGIDICLGLPMDKKASAREYMFLPDYVESSFDKAYLNTGSGTKPLVARKIIINHPEEEEYSNGLFHPLFVFSVFLVIAMAISYRDWKRKKINHGFDAVWLTVLGSIGLLLLLLWVATDHNAAAKNFNLLWALPFHLVAVIAFLRQPQWLRSYFLAVAVLSVLLILGWMVIPQKLHYSLVPVVLAVVVRSFIQYRLRPARV